MIRSRIHFFLLFQLLSFQLLAFDEEVLRTQTLLLVNTMKANHVAPRSIDGAFAEDVHYYLMESLDPRNFIFSAEDEKQLKALAAKIPEDINAGSFSYLQQVEKLFIERVALLKTWAKELESKPFDLKSNITFGRSWTDHRVKASDQRKFFESYLQLSVYSSIFSSKGNKNAPLGADSVKILEAKYRKSICTAYGELFSEIATDPKLLAKSWLDAIALSYDPHSHYFSPAEQREFVAELKAEREIFGISWDKDNEGNLVIIGIVPGSSAWMADEVHEGDKMLKVKFGTGEWIDLTSGEMSPVKLRSLFTENTARELDMLIESEGKQKNVHLEKRPVYSDQDILKNAVIPSKKKYGYIYLPDFYTNWTDQSQLGCANDLAKCILKLQKEHVEGLILDLRGNGGGSLKEAIDIVGIFVDYGPVLGVLDREKKVNNMRDFNRGAIWNGPVMVLIDEESASASEIVAGAVQDYHIGPVVGRPSFGKATSQQVLPLDPVSAMTGNPESSKYGFANVTEGILYRINQTSNQKRGVIPDVDLPFLVGGKNLELEKNYRNALIAPAIDKKFTYTPRTQNFDGLQAIVNARRANDQEFVAQAKYITQLNNLDDQDTTVSLNWLKYESEEEIYTKALDQMEEALEASPAAFVPVTNHFDAELFETDAILKKYNDSFLSRIASDIELREAVKIFNDWFGSN